MEFEIEQLRVALEQAEVALDLAVYDLRAMRVQFDRLVRASAKEQKRARTTERRSAKTDSKEDARTRRRGQLIQRGTDKWLCRAYVGKDINGKRAYLHETVRGSRGVAEKHLEGMLASLKKGIPF